MEPKSSGIKTLGIKLPDELHAQFTLVAQLDGLSLADALRRAVEEYVARKRAEGDFAARAAAALEEIEREAAARRDAIQALFGSGTPASAEVKTTSRRKSGGQG
ncbi:ribbon-helix-helix domain-containing protein [Glycomyces sp. A-F 0318]|uniref:ribbon-helix-helix domain-containing protein n=1 Tax=Glycomyces amatae TaxID=2881355 RepID=UPI001E442CC0|nr:CopG family transcriptional regulator [Glycomyces amatae]MCD0446230.1 ribbon-helix-helix domain-containing protein [Glycomyces amatae]